MPGLSWTGRSCLAAAATLLILLCTFPPPSTSHQISPSLSSSSSTGDNVEKYSSAPVIERWSRNKRSAFDMIDRSFDAMKCTLKILSTEMSQYHSNRLMCCSLWQIKSYLKESAEERCEKPTQIKEVFDHFINEELIYSPISKSLLGDQNLSCAKYSEGSAACSGFMIFVKLIIGVVLLLLILLIFGFCFFCRGFCKYRKQYKQLNRQLTEKNHSDSASTSSSMENNNSSRPFVITKDKIYDRGPFNLSNKLKPKIKPMTHHKHVDTETETSIAKIDIESKV